MKLSTIWYIEDGQPALDGTWTDFEIDGWPEGWAEAKEEAAKERGEIRIIDIEVDYRLIEKAFEPITIDGRIKPEPARPMTTPEKREDHG